MADVISLADIAYLHRNKASGSAIVSALAVFLFSKSSVLRFSRPRVGLEGTVSFDVSHENSLECCSSSSYWIGCLSRGKIVMEKNDYSYAEGNDVWKTLRKWDAAARRTT